MPLGCALLAIVAPALCIASKDGWAPAHAPLMTKWSKDVHPDQVPAYPRPELQREGTWQHLNGLWQVDYTVPNLDNPPFGRNLSERILVPYPVESPLSGIRNTTSHFYMFYRRVFQSSLFACGNKEQSPVLHFEAVDWNATVWVNGKLLGSHAGGYDPFSFTFMDAVDTTGDDVEIIVGVFDPTDEGGQPVGKQSLAAFNDTAKGNHYVPTSGIWQTVWFECVSDQARVEELVPVPTVVLPSQKGSSSVAFDFKVSNVTTSDTCLQIDVLHSNGSTIGVGQCCGQCLAPGGKQQVQVAIPPESLSLWSPESPSTYTFRANTFDAVSHSSLDVLHGHFVMRHVSIGLDAQGVPRPLLNGQFVYPMTTLDQGFWPDGAHTAPTDEALKSDLLALKALGYNGVRKHIKVEPRRWYYYADQIGLMVWQDFVSPNKFMGKVSDEMAALQINEGRAMIQARRQFGCIVQWVTYNEYWGLHGRPDNQTAIAVTAARAADAEFMSGSGRLVNACTGCDAKGAGDVIDDHHYSPPAAPKEGYNTTSGHLMYAANGEYGGVGLALDGHQWITGGCHGYATANDSEALTKTYEQYTDTIAGLVASVGLSASVYTQTSDCERECNGVLTYDRVMKVLPSRWKAANEKVIAAAKRTVLVASDAAVEVVI